MYIHVNNIGELINCKVSNILLETLEKNVKNWIYDKTDYTHIDAEDGKTKGNVSYSKR